jgi:hypothetical protein
MVPRQAFCQPRRIPSNMPAVRLPLFAIRTCSSPGQVQLLPLDVGQHDNVTFISAFLMEGKFTKSKLNGAAS